MLFLTVHPLLITLVGYRRSVEAGNGNGDYRENLGVVERPPAKIMIVEDDEFSMKLIKAILEIHGYSIIPSWSGRNASHIARQEQPDLILMDICLPEGSGLEIIRILKGDEELKQIPIIAVTALAMPEDKERIIRGGADVYLSKPISITELPLVIDGLLKSSPEMPGEYFQFA